MLQPPVTPDSKTNAAPSEYASQHGLSRANQLAIGVVCGKPHLLSSAPNLRGIRRSDSG